MGSHLPQRAHCSTGVLYRSEPTPTGVKSLSIQHPAEWETPNTEFPGSSEGPYPKRLFAEMLYKKC